MLMLKRVVWLTSAIVLAGCSSVSETTSKMFPEMLETAPAVSTTSCTQSGGCSYHVDSKSWWAKWSISKSLLG